jgi:hypothetical protein
VIPLTQETQPPVLEPGQDVQVGDTVRPLRAPYIGMVGRVTAMPAMPHLLASGVRARVAAVDLGSAGKAYIPFENLEVLR